MCHFLVSGYLESSDESQKGIVNRLLNCPVWERERQIICPSSRANTMSGFIAQLVEHRTGIREGQGFESR